MSQALSKSKLYSSLNKLGPLSEGLVRDLYDDGSTIIPGYSYIHYHVPEYKRWFVMSAWMLNGYPNAHNMYMGIKTPNSGSSWSTLLANDISVASLAKLQAYPVLYQADQPARFVSPLPMKWYREWKSYGYYADAIYLGGAFLGEAATCNCPSLVRVLEIDV